MKTLRVLYAFAFVLVAVSAPLVVRAAPGDLYVTAGFNPGSILRFNPAGGRSTFTTGLNGPFGLAFNAATSPTTLFESDNNGGVIYKFTLAGARSTFAMLSNVAGLAVDGSGNLYAADNSFGNIYRYTPAGTRSTFATATGHPFGLAFDTQGNLFVANATFGAGTIVKITPNGTKSTFATGLNNPFGLAFDSFGNLFVTESSVGTIVRFTPNGTRTTFASGLQIPQGLAFDAAGYLFAADYSSGSIYKYAAGGARTTFTTGVSGPYSLAFESGPNVTPTATPTATPRPTATATPRPTATATPRPTATPTPTTSLGNISTRSFVQTGDNVMIGGFIIQGTERKTVIIRAIGPELTQFGVPNVLVNPTLELHDASGALIASNDNWQTTIIGGIIMHSQVQQIINSGHAPMDPRESAIIASLPAGNYTAIVRGVSNTRGVGLAEVYDLSPGSDSRLGNISTRSFVQINDNVMIGGFIVAGTGPKRVIIRAIGPELTQFGVPNVLADPTLELHNGTGALIASNNNWQTTIIGGIIMHDQVMAILSSGHAPTDGRESAIIANLPAGNYTAIVRGVNVTTGVALVEVYDLQPFF